MKKAFTFLMLAIPLILAAQRDWDAIEIKTNPINDRISYLEGSGGNIGVLHGPEGIMIVDDQYAQLSEKIRIALSELSGSDLRFILNTHYHGDHTGGNENLSKDGATIVAHENVRKRLGTTFYSDLWERDIEAKPESFWPIVTFKSELTFYLNGEEIQIIHIPEAHTDGDILIHFKSSNILHTGDAFVRYGYPFIDVAAGGTMDGFIKAQEKILEVADADTKIIPGHGQISSIADVKELKQMLEETRKIVFEMKVARKSLNDCISAKPLADYHERWNGSFITSDLFVRIIYESIKIGVVKGKK